MIIKIKYKLPKNYVVLLYDENVPKGASFGELSW